MGGEYEDRWLDDVSKIKADDLMTACENTW